MYAITVAAWMQEAWHRQGLFMGMHWAWWLFWIAAGLIVLWAFWREFADRRQARREIARMRQAEAALRERYARGEIDQEQLIEALSALLAPPTGPTMGATHGNA
ncbi:MAG: hypothetical protein GWO02_18830 [Gammaproteobacteria bacterium]|nr:hypothetical protein [Gammaproteobacteria bacterium]